MYYNESLYFLWENENEGALKPFPGTDDVNSYLWFFLDPYALLYDQSGNRHSFKGRYYNISSYFSSNNRADAHIITGEYQFQKGFNNGVNITTGSSFSGIIVDDNDLQDHVGSLTSFYAQADKDFGRIVATLGIRWELFNLDTLSSSALPVVRAGINYQAGKNNYLRASFGQGYRFPSIAERFVDTDIGDIINILPNPELKPETGWNAEIGTKQTIRTPNVHAYLDIAAFWTEYTDMTEFSFGFWDSLGLGFRSVNVGKARIAGLEFTFNGEARYRNHPIRFLAGYTYSYPADLTSESGDTTLQSPGKFLSYFFRSFNTNSNIEVLDPLLRYRFRHIFRLDMETDINQFTFGFDINYYSFMEKIDEIFEVLDLFGVDIGIPEFRNINSNGDWVAGLRVGYEFRNKSRITFLVRNALNTEYTLRPGKMEAPRNFTVQYRIKF
jgi:iron complex outermembrane receptor protein